MFAVSEIQRPAVIPLVDHQPGLAAVDAYVLVGDETGLARSQEQDHIFDIQGIAHTARRLLDGVRAFVGGVRGVDPAGGDGVDPDFSCKTGRQRMGQCGDAALGGGVAFGLGLAHAVPGGGNIDDAGPGDKVGRKQLGKIEGYRLSPHHRRELQAIKNRPFWSVKK